jgi:hypothetical protein
VWPLTPPNRARTVEPRQQFWACTTFRERGTLPKDGRPELSPASAVSPYFEPISDAVCIARRATGRLDVGLRRVRRPSRVLIRPLGVVTECARRLPGDDAGSMSTRPPTGAPWGMFRPNLVHGNQSENVIGVVERRPPCRGAGCGACWRPAGGRGADELISIDSISVRAHQHAAGAPARQPHRGTVEFPVRHHARCRRAKLRDVLSARVPLGDSSVPARANPEITQALVDLGRLFFITPIAPFILQYTILAIITFGDQRPQPIYPCRAGYLQLWVSLSFLPGVIAIFLKTDRSCGTAFWCGGFPSPPSARGSRSWSC